MKSRSPMQEVRSFFNPGFIAANIHALAQGYTLNEKKGIPISLLYIGIPLCLHTRTRAALPSNASKRFYLWIQENQQVLVGFGDRASAMKKRVDLGLMFATSTSLTALSDSGGVISLRKPRGFSSLLYNGDSMDCFLASQRVGQMLSRVPNPALIYYMLGVRP